MAAVRSKPKSWRYENTVRWQGEKKGVLSAAGKPDIQMATPPEFRGHPDIWTPEDLFVASVNCCIMTTFLYYAARMQIELVSYRSTADGTVESRPDGLLFTTVNVEPHVLVASDEDRSKAQEAMERSEKACLISRSANAAIVVRSDIATRAHETT